MPDIQMKRSFPVTPSWLHHDSVMIHFQNREKHFIRKKSNYSEHEVRSWMLIPKTRCTSAVD